MVGRALAQALGGQAQALSHADCDITDAARVASVIAEFAPRAIFNCAAITNVDVCETHRDLADHVNMRGVETIAAECHRHGVTLIHFSTDYVFDGAGDTPFSENHPRHPVNHYGQSKAASEQYVQQCCPDHIIARVQWVFGLGRSNFVDDTARKLGVGEAVRAFSDQYGSPTYANDIATMVTQLYREGHRGTFHTVNKEYASRVEIAHEIARQLRISAPQIIPVTTASISLPAQRPLNSRLSIDKISKLGIHPPTWQDAVGRYLKNL